DHIIVRNDSSVTPPIAAFFDSTSSSSGHNSGRYAIESSSGSVPVPSEFPYADPQTQYLKIGGSYLLGYSATPVMLPTNPLHSLNLWLSNVRSIAGATLAIP